MHCLMLEDRDTTCCKRRIDVRDIETIKKHLNGQAEQHKAEDKKPVIAADIPLYVPSDIDV